MVPQLCWLSRPSQPLTHAHAPPSKNSAGPGLGAVQGRSWGLMHVPSMSPHGLGPQWLLGK